MLEEVRKKWYCGIRRARYLGIRAEVSAGHSHMFWRLWPPAILSHHSHKLLGSGRRSGGDEHTALRGRARACSTRAQTHLSYSRGFPFPTATQMQGVRAASIAQDWVNVPFCSALQLWGKDWVGNTGKCSRVICHLSAVDSSPLRG